MQQIRRIDLLWEGDNVEIYERLKQQAVNLEKEIPEFVKEIIEREVGRDNDG
jgi:predicted DNA-binding protein